MNFNAGVYTVIPTFFKNSEVDFEQLEKSIKIVSLENLIDIYPKMLKGETSGRYIVDLNK